MGHGLGQDDRKLRGGLTIRRLRYRGGSGTGWGRGLSYDDGVDTIIISLATRSIQLPPFGFVDLLPPGNYKWYHYCRDNGLTRKAPDANYVGERHPETEWPHGKGTLTDQNGDKREGTWENGKPLEVTVTYAADAWLSGCFSRVAKSEGSGAK